MKEIIWDKTYDTEVSTHIITIWREGEDGDMLDCFRLYKTNDGDYFFWVSDQTGPDWIEPCTEQEIKDVFIKKGWDFREVSREVSNINIDEIFVE